MPTLGFFFSVGVFRSLPTHRDREVMRFQSKKKRLAKKAAKRAAKRG